MSWKKSPEFSSIGRKDWIQAVVFPLAALMIIAAIPLLLTVAGFGETNTVAFRDLRFASIESPILRSAAGEIAEKRRALDEKDVRIRQYQGRIAELDGRLQVIQGLMRDTLRRKEGQLLEEIESILGDERRRLQALGRSDQQIDAALDRLKTNLDSDYSEKMEEYRYLELQVYEIRLADLKREKEGLEKALATAVDERRLLADELDDQESEILTRLYKEKELRDIETADIRADLEMLRESREAENYWLDELANQYIGLLDALSLQNKEKAGEHLSALESLFDDSMISSLPGIASRNEADRELVRFFSSYLNALDREDREVILAETTRLVELAKTHTEEGRLQEADLTWQRLMALWPLMGSALTAYTETSDSLVSSEFRQFTSASESYLKINDFENASRAMRQANSSVPGSLGEELRQAWELWSAAQEDRLVRREQTAIDALSLEMQESAARNTALRLNQERLREELIDAANEEKAALTRRIAELEVEQAVLAQRISEQEKELEAAAAAPVEPESQDPADVNSALATARKELAVSQQRIEDLQKQIFDLENRLTETEMAASGIGVEEIALRWRLYGVIVQIVGETLVIEPLVDQIPAPGSQMRVMRSLGEDSVMQLADGTILEADRTRATAKISTDSGGSGSFGKPERDDLIYLTAP
jgi:chromosome segregation ATPase